MEEAPLSDVQRLTEKLELLSGETMEKKFPGLKAEFDLLRDIRAEGAMKDDAFWRWVGVLADRHGVDEEKLNQVLQDR